MGVFTPRNRLTLYESGLLGITLPHPQEPVYQRIPGTMAAILNLTVHQNHKCRSSPSQRFWFSWSGWRLGILLFRNSLGDSNEYPRFKTTAYKYFQPAFDLFIVQETFGCFLNTSLRKNKSTLSSSEFSSPGTAVHEKIVECLAQSYWLFSAGNRSWGCLGVTSSPSHQPSNTRVWLLYVACYF